MRGMKRLFALLLAALLACAGLPVALMEGAGYEETPQWVEFEEQAVCPDLDFDSEAAAAGYINRAMAVNQQGGVMFRAAYGSVAGHRLTGIGWGCYRQHSIGVFGGTSDYTYATHNVYIQLLCETGVAGLAAFLAAVGNILIAASYRYRKLVLTDPDSEERVITGAGIFLQVFFLAYCMSGNPLYDYNFVVSYFIGVLLTLTVPEAKESKARESGHSYILKRT